ncbi:hypothetical protein [Pedobacter aquatilis]|nr:hypothetical protein [Pedobacter aquatilis]
MKNTTNEIQFPEVESHGPVVMVNLIKFKDKRLYFEEYLPALQEKF